MLLYPAERKMKAYQWCKHCHSYSRKGIVAKVQRIEYDASGVIISIQVQVHS
jgi:hypothetical protein